MSSLTPDGWPDMDIPNDRVAGVADQFRDAANLLFQGLPQHSLVSPLMVVAALAAELYLKSLNAKNVYHDLREEMGVEGWRITSQAAKSGHDLRTLYDALPPEIRQGLEEAYTVRPAGRRSSSVLAAVAAYSRVFVDSRYPFEDPGKVTGTSISGLMDLANFLGDFVVRMRTTRAGGSQGGTT